MKPGTAKETAIICAAAVAALALLTLPFERAAGGAGANSGYPFWIVGAVAATVVVILRYRYLTAQKRVQVELASGEQYRQLADEFRRLTDLAITAQEHIDLKLADISAQLDFLREQADSMQKILKDVE